MLNIYNKSIFDVFSPLFTLQRTLRHMMPSENNIAGQYGQAVMPADGFGQTFCLIEAAKQPPFPAQRHGKHGIYACAVQPRRCVVEHQLLQRQPHTRIGLMFERMNHIAHGRLVINRCPQTLKRRRFLLALPAHRPARNGLDTAGAGIGSLCPALRQICRTTCAEAV